MIHFNNINKQWFGLLFTLVSAILITSCADDNLHETEPIANGINFNVLTQETRSIPITTDTILSVNCIPMSSSVISDSLWLIYTESPYQEILMSKEDSDTRAAPVNTMYNSFKVYAYAFMGDWSDENTPNLMNNVTVNKVSNGWRADEIYYWPGINKTVRFYGYAPIDQTNLTVEAVKGAPKLSLTIPNDVAKQKDLLLAKKECAGYLNSSVELKFNHVLTAIQFKTTSDLVDCTIKSISLKNVYSKGDFPTSGDVWTNQGTPTTFTQTLNKQVNSPQDVISGDLTFMMLPQTLPEGAKVEVIFVETFTGKERVLTADIAGNIWGVGKKITYSISSTNLKLTYHLNVSGDLTYAHSGGNKTYNVESYASNLLGEKYPISWSTEYSTDGGTTWSASCPNWITQTTSGSGSISGAVSYTSTVGAQASQSIPSSNVLRSRDAVGVTTPYDLSTKGSKTPMNTANCYMINAPGQYKFPLVFGNAIKNGVDNPNSYTGSNFIAGSGNTINGPWIKNNVGSTPANAVLVWQDVNNLVSDIILDGDYIRFKVNKDIIAEGNAIIAVRSADNYIRWSWHIWVTTWDESIFMAANNNQMMTVNLGLVNVDNITHYPKRTALVRFKQAGNTEYKQLTINQKEKILPTTGWGYSPYYQWGRKDPMCPVNSIGNGRMTVYSTSGYEPNVYDNLNGSNRLGKVWGMIWPHTFFIKTKQTQNENNAWGSDLHEKDWGDLIGKTIYDPSPVGFIVPHINGFAGFKNIGTWSNGTNIGVTENDVSFFRALGNIHPQRMDVLYFEVNTGGKFWSRNFPCPGFPYRAHSMDFRLNENLNDMSRPNGAGCSIRSVKE